MQQTTDLLIIGAGPTGLSLACQLIRYGVDFLILDKKQGVTPYSKAIGVHARTLEIYEQIDLAQRAIEEGAIAGKARLLADGKVRGELEFSQIGRGFSPYPFVLMLEQSKTKNFCTSICKVMAKRSTGTLNSKISSKVIWVLRQK